MRRYVVIAAGTGLIAAVLSVTGALPVLAQGALKPLAALIVNDESSPVPVRVTNPTAPVTGSLAPSKPSDLVTLQGRTTACGGNRGTVADTQVLSTGIQPFVIPAGQVLVITGMGLRTRFDVPTLTALRFGLSFPSEVALEDELLAGPFVAADVNDFVVAKTIAVPNIVVAPGAPICVFTTTNESRPNPVYVYGFLAKDE
jgi:hypothetical protein